jgi:propanediol utilization protein/ethanolamine utilization cobalamin adenosyltransferase
VILTETELRARWHKDKCGRITVPRGSVLTPSARDFLRAHGIELAVAGEGVVDLNSHILATAAPAPKASPSPGAKPEHMTHLRGARLVAKTHPVIAWRGQMDLFDCRLVEAQAVLAAGGEEALAAELDEVALFARRLMAAEVRDRPFAFGTLCGWSVDEVRDISHHPDRHFGNGHTAMSYRDGLPVALLNGLRAKAREVELFANRAFGDGGEPPRPDLLLALNRLSSLLYVLVCRQKAAKREEKRLPVGVSGRHVHLSQADLDRLFGAGYTLRKLKDLSQPGQFAAQETVRAEGPKGSLDNVRILGPVRSSSQVEISATDAFRLGVRPVVRDSGQLEDTPPLRLTGPAGAVDLARGAIVAARHIHLHPDQAAAWHLTDGQRVQVRIDGDRPTVFADVLVRVSPSFRGELHLDTDEANAALASGDTQAIIVGV